MGQNGGARPGAGRKRKAEKFETPIQKAEGMIVDKLPWLVDKAMQLADGVTVQKPTLVGGTVIYKEPPDLGAIKYLIDRVMGKPTERKEISGPDGGDLIIRTVSTALDKAYGSTSDSTDPADPAE
jgi:hypothetical protein